MPLNQCSNIGLSFSGSDQSHFHFSSKEFGATRRKQKNAKKPPNYLKKLCIKKFGPFKTLAKSTVRVSNVLSRYSGRGPSSDLVLE